jgi:hypothetical protein
MDDNDEALHFYDIQGESLYTNPPDPNYPIIDHGLEEDKVWAFKLTYFNQIVINNDYKNDLGSTKNKSNLPFWAMKLAAPAFFKREKWEKMMLQWKWRMGLEYIKQQHSLTHNPGDQQLKLKQKREIMNYLAWVKEQ